MDHESHPVRDRKSFIFGCALAAVVSGVVIALFSPWVSVIIILATAFAAFALEFRRQRKARSPSATESAAERTAQED
jgi:Flp pilus assembly protein TadB